MRRCEDAIVIDGSDVTENTDASIKSRSNALERTVSRLETVINSASCECSFVLFPKA